MDCIKNNKQGVEILTDYCAGSLNPKVAFEIDTHIQRCAECREMVEAQRTVWEMLDAWTPPEVSQNFDARLYARIAEERALPVWRWVRTEPLCPTFDGIERQRFPLQARGRWFEPSCAHHDPLTRTCGPLGASSSRSIRVPSMSFMQGEVKRFPGRISYLGLTASRNSTAYSTRPEQRSQQQTPTSQTSRSGPLRLPAHG